MVEQRANKLNRLERELPEGLLVDSAWLTKRDYATNLRAHYLATGRLEQPARRVYRRPRGTLTWQQVAVSLQTLLEYPLVVGGRTALELQGYAHFLSHTVTQVHLYGPKPPPNWLHDLKLDARFTYHNSSALFRSDPAARRLPGLDWNGKTDQGDESLVVQPWGQWNWPLVLSTCERAVLELLDELPAHESFHQVDKLIEGLVNLSPRRMQKLLADCRSVKVKRLFFFFADRHQHSWLKRLDKKAIYLGKGKRMLVKGGKLDPTYQITMPEDLNGIQ